MAGNFEVINVTGNPPATIVIERGFPACILNMDSTNTLLLGKTNDILPGYQFIGPLGPGVSADFDGEEDVYGICLKGVSINVLSLPGAKHISGATAQTPSSNAPAVASQNGVGSGSTVDLIGTALNPQGLEIQLLSLSLSAFCAAGSPSAINLQDVIQDSNSKPYLTVQLGLPSTGGLVTSNLSQTMHNATVPAGRKLQIVNGGGIGILHQCGGTAVYYLINDPI